MKTNADQPINPTIWDSRHNPEFERDNDGLTIRQHFAGLAMASYYGGQYTGQAGMPFTDIASNCVQMADALIEALNK